MKICNDLAEDYVEALVDYARAMQSGKAKFNGDKEWDRILNDPRTAPKLGQFIKEAQAEGDAEPMNFDKL